MELRRSSHYDAFESNSERDIKRVFYIGYQFGSLVRNLVREILESLQKNINQGRESFCCSDPRNRIFGTLPNLCIAGFKGREKMNKFKQDRKYIASQLSVSISSTNYELAKVLPQVSGLTIWRSSGKFGHEMNLKGWIQYY